MNKTVPIVDFLKAEQAALEEFAAHWVEMAKKPAPPIPFPEKLTLEDWAEQYDAWKELKAMKEL